MNTNIFYITYNKKELKNISLNFKNYIMAKIFVKYNSLIKTKSEI